MRKIKIAVLIISLLALSAPSVFSAEKKNEAAKTVPEKELTKTDLIEHIKGNLDHIQEILNFIPGLKKEVDPTGSAIYTYQGGKIEDLDREQLIKLYSRINSEAVRIRTEKLNRQLESIMRANELTRQANQSARIPTPPLAPPQPPVLYVPPQPPSPPPAATQPPSRPAPQQEPPRR